MPVDQAPVLQMFQDRVVWRFRRFRQRVADPALMLRKLGFGLTAGLASHAHLLPDHDRLLAPLDDEVGAPHTSAAPSPPERGS